LGQRGQLPRDEPRYGDGVDREVGIAISESPATQRNGKYNELFLAAYEEKLGTQKQTDDEGPEKTRKRRNKTIQL
jgi:hypothetical protein